MGHYKSNVRDLEFNLFEVLGVQERLGKGVLAESDEETARGVLSELNNLAVGPLAESFVDADRNPPVYDPKTFSATLPESFKKSYQALWEGEWWRLGLPNHLGGFGLPPTVQWAASELILGANPALYMYMAGPNFAMVIDRNGTEEQKRWARIMIDRGWGATMVLTEPDAGSDVGAGRTKAVKQEDGSWHLEGVKRFITSGDQDMTENIMHLVLARPEGPGIEPKPGTKGLSLFLVPKFLFDTNTGELGERNGVFVTGVEEKMGLKVSTTCELTFGQHGTPAKGWLLGEVHDGIAQMFQVIEYARMMVGTKAIATLSTGYLNALEYAKERVQGPDLTRQTDKTAPRVTITHHPDVVPGPGMDPGGRRRVARSGRTRQRPAAAHRQGGRLRAGQRAAHPVTADPRWFRLPAGLPHRAVHPRLEDRLAVRGHHRHPVDGLLLPQDRPRQGQGADLPRRRDHEVHRVGVGQRPTQEGTRPAQAGAGRPPGHARRDARLPHVGAGGRDQHLQGGSAHRATADVGR